MGLGNHKGFTDGTIEVGWAEEVVPQFSSSILMESVTKINTAMIYEVDK
jgi:hypothetical protein